MVDEERKSRARVAPPAARRVRDRPASATHVAPARTLLADLAEGQTLLRAGAHAREELGRVQGRPAGEVADLEPT
jgi:hypothetical protein